MIRKLLITFMLVVLALVAAACSSSNTNNNAEHNNSEHSNAEHDHGDAEHEHDSTEMAPNNGAVITLLSPADGDTFTADAEINVAVEVENFSLGADGNHWHIYVGDTEYAMVVGENTSDVIRGLEPGEYTITVRLANGDHQDLEDGDSATITISE